MPDFFIEMNASDASTPTELSVPGGASTPPAAVKMSPGKEPTLVRATTLAQIAEFVGVSRVVVSVVLNNSSSQVRVSAKTRQRIFDAARQLNYQANPLALSLMNRRTNIIGFYSTQHRVFDPIFPFYGYLLQGMLKGCSQHKKHFLIHGTFDEMSEDDIFLELLNGQIDGLILYAHDLSPFTTRLAESHLPVVTVADEVPGLPFVTVDDELGGSLLASHLAQKGYRRVLYWVEDAVLPSSIQRRLHGFQEEAARYELEVEVFHTQSQWPFENDLRGLLARSDPPQVIAAYSDFAAAHIFSWYTSHGVRVPQDIAITGFDGFSNVWGVTTPITTVGAPWAEVARIAVSHLVRQCQGEAIPICTQLPVQLIPGDST